MIRVKVYGTIRGEKRLIRRGKAIAVTRDNKGRFKSVRKWSPNRPNKKPQYKEVYVEGRTGKDVIRETLKVVRFYDWMESPRIECDPYPRIGEWLETWVRQ